MTPYYTDDWLTVWQGDCRDVMAQMEPESVHCVVTSPPYWGLRDYGTATWIGGDEGCDHRNGRFTRQGLSEKQASNNGSAGDEAARTCKCGAIRQDSQLGLEPTPEEYVANMVAVFREVRRVLRKDGTCWVNLGDSYAAGGSNTPSNDKPAEISAARRNDSFRAAKYSYLPPNTAVSGLKPKDLCGIPWRVAFALQADGWYLRSDIIWSKPNPMPESVTDRPTKAHEYVFLLSKSARYYYDADAVRETRTDSNGSRAEAIERHGTTDGIPTSAAKLPDSPYHAHKGARRGLHGVGTTFVADPTGRNLRTVWSIATQPYPGAHFATFPEKLVEPCVKAGSPVDGVVLDPFAGSGTTGRVAQRLGRRAVLIDLSGDYLVQAIRRNAEIPLGLEAV